MPTFHFLSTNYPTSPGCYVMRDAQARVLYVGKAKNLRRRLGSYFRPGAGGRTRRLARRIATIEVILVNNDTESLILETHLLARYRPPHNRAFWRVDHGYPYIALTAEPFPRLVPYQPGATNEELGDVPVRQRFGPFLSRNFRDAVLDFARDHFGLRTCVPLPRACCLRFHLHRCLAPCIEEGLARRYAGAVRRAVTFLSAGRHTTLLRRMREQMWAHAARLEFEQAGYLKTRIAVLERALERQVIEREVEYDQEVLYVGAGHALAAPIHSGILQGVEIFPLPADPTAALLARYRERCPREIIVNAEAPVVQWAEALHAIGGEAFVITPPRDAGEVALMELCRMNYAYRQGVKA